MGDLHTADCDRDPEARGTAPPVDVSVLVPVLNEARSLAAALDDMLAQQFPGTFELLVLDGGSTDGSRELLEAAAARDPRVRVFDNPARRTPHALNRGLRHARGTWVARMDAHTRYPHDYLRRGVERLRHGDVVSVSGPQLAVGDDPWSRRVALALSTPLGVGSARFRRLPDDETEVESGFTGLWRRDVLLAAGGWDEQWLNDQDTELAARLRGSGGRLVCLPEMAAAYVPRNSLRALFVQYRRYGWYRVKTSHRHPETLRAAQLLPPALLAAGALAASGPRMMNRPARGAVAAYVLALGATAVSRLRTDPVRDVALLPVVHGVMHVGYGLGFWTGVLRLGPPLAALRRVLDLPIGRTSQEEPR